MKSLPSRLRRAVVAAGTMPALPLVDTGTATAHTAPQPTVPPTVAADILPTTQVDGVVRLRTDRAPTPGAYGLASAASPDGSTMVVGGDFATVSGVSRARVAALDAATGTEPSIWVCRTTDTTAVLPMPNVVGAVGHLSSSATAGVGIRSANLSVVTP